MTERYVTVRDLLDDRVRQSEKELCYTFLVGFEVRNQWNYADLYREVAKVGASLAGESITSEVRLTHEALCDAVFTAPGALEWLSGLRRLIVETARRL